MLAVMRTISNNIVPVMIMSAVFFVVMMIYGYVSSDYDDEDSVTFTFRCSSVLAARANYPVEISAACDKLRQEQ
jgi:hypothetical protein